MRHLRALSGVAGSALLFSIFTAVTGSTARAEDPVGDVADAIAAGALPDVREIDPNTRYPLAPGVADALDSWRETAAGRAQLQQTAGATPEVGTKRMWLSLDDVKQQVYLKEYTLRGVGDKIEVWVASGTSGVGADQTTGTEPLAGDCRTVVPDSFTVTDPQIERLINEYDTTMLPTSSKAFSVAPERDGSQSVKEGLTEGLDFTGDGDKVVTLIDNVRDPNFYDFPANQTYIAGFFSRQFNELTDRNVMTIDAYDWAHRVGENPAHEPDGDICKSRPSRPLTYEGIFIHEYQHLLQYYADPSEVNFVNEGLSDYVVSLVGYADTTKSVFELGSESHITCYQGFGTLTTEFQPNARPCGGPQNSLTLWGDEGQGAEILADYGVAWQFLLLLEDRYGPKVLEFIHRDGERQGLASVQAALDEHAGGIKAADVLHDFQLSTLVDKVVDTKGGKIAGIKRNRVVSKSVDSTINLLNPATHTAPGVAPNGADYVPLRGKGLGFLKGDELRKVTFSGVKTLAPNPLGWTVVPRTPILPPVAAQPQGVGTEPQEVLPATELPPGIADNPVLFSGNEGSLNRSAVVPVTVPEDKPQLSFSTSYSLEKDFDYGFVVVSTDGGKTYTKLANDKTVETVAPAPPGPALTGKTTGTVPMTFDLSEYAGEEVVLGFQFLSDPLVNEGGWYIDDVRVGNELINDGSTTAPFQTFTQVFPVQVDNWAVTLVGLDEEGNRARVIRRNGLFDFALKAKQLKKFRSFPIVVAIVSYDDPGETVQNYAPYSLKINGIGQPGG